jgi:protoheme IX farnesyltransferase
MFKDLLALTKPGIIFGNLIASVSGFLLAAQGNVDFFLLAMMVIGTTLVIASGCIFNNYIDRDIDQKMARTQDRALAQGRVSGSLALSLGTITGALGFYTLYAGTNTMALLFGVIGFIVYVGFYTLRYKRSSVYGTLVGSLSGACPPVIGYVSVTGNFDVGAAILLVTFCFWQIPHSYAIAICRYSDYKAANIPVLPVEQGLEAARFHMYFYIMGFALAALLLAERGYAGTIYTLVISLMSLYWLYLVKAGNKFQDEVAWGRKLFVFSIVTITVFSVLISFDYVVKPVEDTVVFASL